MPDNPLKAAAIALVAPAAALASYASDPSDRRIKPTLEQLGKLLEQIRDLVNGSRTSTIADFFNAIGCGIIEAQNRLDRASEEYVRSSLRMDSGRAATATTAPALGTMYRIPRVTAELKCSMATDHEKGFNVVFYSERSDVRDLHQQTVQLEVVSVPVPPDYINYLRAQPTAQPAARSPEPPAEQPGALSDAEPGAQEAPPASPQGPLVLSEPAGEDARPVRPDPEPARSTPRPPAADMPSHGSWLETALVNETERATIRALIEKLDGRYASDPGLRPSPVARLLLPYWSRAVVLTDGHNARFILLSTVHKRPRLLLWQLVLRPPSLQLLYKMPAQALNELARVQRFLSELGLAQAATRRRVS